jgi:hypothetical protein
MRNSSMANVRGSGSLQDKQQAIEPAVNTRRAQQDHHHQMKYL